MTSSCGSTPVDPAEDDGGRSRAVDVNVALLLSRAGRSSNDHNLTVGLSDRELSCEGDRWSIRVYYGRTRPPPIERLIAVTCDMPAGVLAKGWELAREEDIEHWLLKLSAEEVGFGCDERYATSFFLLGAWGDKVSRPLGFERASSGVFKDFLYEDNPDEIEYSLFFNVNEIDLPVPDTSAFYLKTLFTGATSSADVAVDSGSFGSSAKLEVNLTALGLGSAADVAVGAVLKRDGVALMSHCFTVPYDRLP